MWALIYQYTLAYFDLLDETAKCHVQRRSKLVIYKTAKCVVSEVCGIHYNTGTAHRWTLSPLPPRRYDGRYIGRGRTRYKYHVTEGCYCACASPLPPRRYGGRYIGRGRQGLSRDREVLMRMRVTLVDEEVGGRYIGRGRTRYIT